MNEQTNDRTLISDLILLLSPERSKKILKMSLFILRVNGPVLKPNPANSDP